MEASLRQLHRSTKNSACKRAAYTEKCYFCARQADGKNIDTPLSGGTGYRQTCIGRQSVCKAPTNGIRGSLKYSDSEWCTWNDNDSVSFTIDLLKPETLNTLTLGCITNNGMAIHKPSSVKVEVSDDNSSFCEAAMRSFTPEEIFREGNFIENLPLKLRGTQARYVRVTAKAAGSLSGISCTAGTGRRESF